MLETIYVGLTGLDSYSKGLNVISNNVANLNTVGFKGSALQFADLYYRNDGTGLGGDAQQQIGGGVGTGGTFLNFQAGEGRQTGNDLDAMIDGPGLFVLRKDGDTYFSRAGQFEFDRDNFLVDKANQARIAALDDSGQLHDLSITGLRANPAKTTSRIKFAGNLSTGDTQHVVADVTAYDPLGAASKLKLTFDNTNVATPGSWKVTAATADGTEVGSGEIRFKGTKPEIGFDAVTLSFTPKDGEPVTTVLDFSVDTTGSSAGADSTFAVSTQDGYAAGSLVKASFDVDGNFVLTYSNAQTEKHGRLALAFFNNTDALEQLGSNVYVNRFGQAPDLGRAGEREFGKITARSVEGSNVDLSQQFSDMIITQRGYQASSQVITTANEMIQQLLDMRGRR